MFGLDTGALAEPRLTMDHFKEWAGSITGSYFNEGIPPNTSLEKIAQSEDLTPHQIQVLAGETNKMIHMQKYANAGNEDKYFAADFPHADFKEVLKNLQADGGSAKIAVQMIDPVVSDNGPDPFTMFGVKLEEIDKTASVKGEMKVASHKIALLHQKLKDRVILNKYAAEAAERNMIKKARQFVLNGSNSSERLQLLGQIDHMAKEAGLGSASSPLAKLAYVLKEEGLIDPLSAKETVEYFMSKEADQKAPESLISNWLEAKIINGQHPLYITLKTFHDSNDALRTSEDQFNLVDDKLKILKQKVRAL